MMALDSLNTLDSDPLPNLEAFLDSCVHMNVSEINLTGTNTDPLLYKHHKNLTDRIRQRIPGVTLGIRTNGAKILDALDVWDMYDKASISITSMNPEVYKKTMGSGTPPDLRKILTASNKPIKINLVMCPENINDNDFVRSLDVFSEHGIKKVNLREPYGQPHIGDPCAKLNWHRNNDVLGMPCYTYKGMSIVVWDVHYVEVESVNLYANGNVSITYPITKGHCNKTGQVLGQENFNKSGRIREQWVNLKVRK